MNERAKRILQLISSKDVSYADISKATGIPKSALQRYATGETEKIPIDRMEILASYFNVNVAYLMGWEETKSIIPEKFEQPTSLSKVLKQRRRELGLTLFDIAKKMGVSEATVQRWESGNIKSLRFERIAKLAKVLNVEPYEIIGWDVTKRVILDAFDPLLRTVIRPRLGAITCGVPINSEENFDGFDIVPNNIKCDFTLKCEGDSMTGVRINDGDIVYIRQQETVDNGQIAAVLVDGTNMLLKRVYIMEKSIVLQAENYACEPLFFMGDEMNRVQIIGFAVGFTSVI